MGETEATPDPPAPSPSLEEMALVRAMLAGDELALEAFGDGYFPGLLRFALARLHGDSDLARDLVQTTVCKALTKLKGFRGEAPLFAWLCACCRNEIAMHFRKKSHRPRLVTLDDMPADSSSGAEPTPSPFPGLGGSGESPDRALLRKEKGDRVHRALDLLPPHYARALEWKYLQRLPVNEIATRLEQSPKATESLLTRARNAFRQHYEDLSRPPDNIRPFRKLEAPS